MDQHPLAPQRLLDLMERGRRYTEMQGVTLTRWHNRDTSFTPVRIAAAFLLVYAAQRGVRFVIPRITWVLRLLPML